MSGHILIYGANGYTGRLTARLAKSSGLKPVLAGRNAALIKAVADSHSFEWRAFDLSDPAVLDHNLAGTRVLLNMAGPFSSTTKPLLDACLRNRVHYLDITGELDVIEGISGRFAEAQGQGVMMMPGIGFDVVPSDCLLAHTARRLPQTHRLTLAISGLTTMSRGTAKTAVEALGIGPRIRQDGAIVELDVAPRRDFDFGSGWTDCVGIGWGDIASAYHSTAVPNIQVFMEMTPDLERVSKLSPLARWMMRRKFIQSHLKKRMDLRPEGPDRDQRQYGKVQLVAIAEDGNGRQAISRLTTPEAYTLTARMAVDIASRIADGAAMPGFFTPARFLGSDYILEFDGVTREDL